MRKPALSLNMELIGYDLKIDPFADDPIDPTGVFNLSYYIPKVIDLLFTAATVEDTVAVTLSDSVVITLPREQVVFNVILWRVLLACKIPVTERYVFKFTTITESTLAEYHNKIYKDCLAQKPHKKRLYALFADSINLMFNISLKYAMYKVTALSYTDLLEVYLHPEVVKMRESLAPTSEFYSTSDFEAKAKQLTKDLKTFIASLPRTNPVKQLYIGGKLNPSQMFQTFLAYGPRADLDHRILGNPIYTNTINGYRNLSDYAKESVSSKISSVFNQVMVSKAATFMRIAELIMTELYVLDPMPCNNNKRLPFYFEPGKVDRYLGKLIFEGDQEVIITEENFHLYEGRTVDILSPIDCQTRAGVCARCLSGIADYIDDTNHIGMRIASEAFSDLMQLLLSAKHLTKSDTIPYILPMEAKRYVQAISATSFKLEPLEPGYKIAFDSNQMAHPSKINNLNIAVLMDSSWIRTMYILDSNDEVVVAVPLESDDGNKPYLTDRFYKYLKDDPSKIRVLHNHDTQCMIKDKKVIATLYAVDVSEWPFKRVTLFKAQNKNRDTPAYVSSINSFFMTKIATYNDRAAVLKDFSELVYQKSELHIAFLEMLIRGLIVTNEKRMEIGDLIGEELVFGKGSKIVFGRTFCNGMLYQDQLSLKGGRGLLYRPETYMEERSAGRYASFFGL